MNPIVIGISVGLITFIITNVILYIVRKYFFYQPKVVVNFRGNHSSSGLVNNDKIQLEWNYDIVLQNITKYDAISVLIDYIEFASSAVTNQKFTHIRSLSEEKLNLRFSEVFVREIVENSKNRFVDLIPDKYRNAKIILTYKNEMNKNFFTKYIRTPEGDKNTFHKRRPKIKKS